MPAPQLILQFALQVIVILIVCRLAGRVMATIGQPRVIGEMIAGILLGPSLLGLISITPTLFTVMVLMTLVTTVAAGPLFERAWRSSKEVADIGALRAH
jgi:NhaP-type Na+/H+ or K+/H+ antiporter